MTTKRERQIPPAEWIASIIGGLIVLGTIGFLAYEAFVRGEQDPALSVSIVQVREVAGAFAVDVEVQNRTRGAAADVQLVGTSRAPDGGEMQAYARIDYVPGASRRPATLVFASHPGDAPNIRVIGYTRP